MAIHFCIEFAFPYAREAARTENPTLRKFAPGATHTSTPPNETYLKRVWGSNFGFCPHVSLFYERVAKHNPASIGRRTNPSTHTSYPWRVRFLVRALASMDRHVVDPSVFLVLQMLICTLVNDILTIAFSYVVALVFIAIQYVDLIACLFA